MTTEPTKPHIHWDWGSFPLKLEQTEMK